MDDYIGDAVNPETRYGIKILLKLVKWGKAYGRVQKGMEQAARPP